MEFLQRGKRVLLGRFFEGLVGIEEVTEAIGLERAEKVEEDIGVLGIMIGVLDESAGVLEGVEGVGEGEEERGVGGEREEEA